MCGKSASDIPLPWSSTERINQPSATRARMIIFVPGRLFEAAFIKRLQRHCSSKAWSTLTIGRFLSAFDRYGIPTNAVRERDRWPLE